MSFNGRGRGAGRGGGGFSGGRGGRGGGRGGFGGSGPREAEGPPANVVELGTFVLASEGDMVCRNTNEKVR